MDGLDVLRENPELATFPLLAGVTGLVYFAVLFGGGSVLVVTDGKKPSEFDDVDFTTLE